MFSDVTDTCSKNDFCDNRQIPVNSTTPNKNSKKANNVTFLQGFSEFHLYREEAIIIYEALKDASPFLASRLVGKIENYKNFIIY